MFGLPQSVIWKPVLRRRCAVGGINVAGIRLGWPEWTSILVTLLLMYDIATHTCILVTLLFMWCLTALCRITLSGSTATFSKYRVQHTSGKHDPPKCTAHAGVTADGFLWPLMYTSEQGQPTSTWRPGTINSTLAYNELEPFAVSAYPARILA